MKVEITAKSMDAANFMSAFLEDYPDIEMSASSHGHKCIAPEFLFDRLCKEARRNGISSAEFEAGRIEESMKIKNRLQENALTSDRVFVAPKTRDADLCLQDMGYTKQGFIYSMKVEDLADFLSSCEIDESDLSVKDENGEPIEDVLSLVYDADDEDDFDMDYEDDDDEIYFEPGEGDEYFLDDEEDDF